ncbi:hypothetical protein BgiBS90_012810, partial [Biomphalaria glabrata]
IHKERLMGFQIRTSYNKNLRNYKDKSLMPLDKYTVLEPRQASPIRILEVKATTDSDGTYLSLCEVEVYG